MPTIRQNYGELKLRQENNLRLTAEACEMGDEFKKVIKPLFEKWLDAGFKHEDILYAVMMEAHEISLLDIL